MFFFVLIVSLVAEVLAMEKREGCDIDKDNLYENFFSMKLGQTTFDKAVIIGKFLDINNQEKELQIELKKDRRLGEYNTGYGKLFREYFQKSGFSKKNNKFSVKISYGVTEVPPYFFEKDCYKKFFNFFKELSQKNDFIWGKMFRTIEKNKEDTLKEKPRWRSERGKGDCAEKEVSNIPETKPCGKKNYKTRKKFKSDKEIASIREKKITTWYKKGIIIGKGNTSPVYQKIDIISDQGSSSDKQIEIIYRGCPYTIIEADEDISSFSVEN